MEHYRNPRNREKLERPDFASGQFNPSCGDQVSIEGMREGEVITKLAFTGTGCVISQATASLLTEWCTGKTVAEIMALDAEAIQELIDMQLGPVRLKCALLPLYALHAGLKKEHDAGSNKAAAGIGSSNG